jgi:LysM repeat protein
LFIPSATPFFFNPPSPTPYLLPTAYVIPTLNLGGNTGGLATAVPVVCNPPNGWMRYIVQSGDTLGVLASRTGTTLTTLINANCLANPNLLSVGQGLYLPRAPIAPSQSATAQSQTMALSLTPATLVQGSYRVTPGRVTLVADNIRAGVRVIFYYNYPGGATAFLGESPVFGTRAQLSWDTSNVPRETGIYLTAVSLAESGQYVQYSNRIAMLRTDSTVLVTPSAAPRPPELGLLSLTPAQAVNDPGLRYRVRTGSVTITLSTNRNATAVRFLYFSSPNAEPQILSLVSNPIAEQPIQAIWSVQCSAPFSGRLTAQAVNAAGVTALSGSLDVYCDPFAP